MSIIQEGYCDYQPPRWILPTVERLLSGIPGTYLSGITSIVLTNSAAVGRGKRRVGSRKIARRSALGIYRSKASGADAYITLVVDNIVAGAPANIVRFNLGRDTVVANVLFHEIGHHLDYHVGARARAGEPAAEDWNKRLGRMYFRRRYWWVRPFAPLLLWIVRILMRLAPRQPPG